ncbi:MAG: MBL fold metallo-hydrolase [Gammaproteobacteria bacterium]|nr:MBL fold metallo-hydrolase [Gammaproteobacteria bacterium]
MRQIRPYISTLYLGVAATVLAFPLGDARSQSVEPDGTSAEARIAAHIENARRLAGTELTAPFEFFCVPGNARPNDFSAPPLEPVRLFDNLYALGNSETVVYAITTSEGIVLIDAGVAAEVEPVLLPGLVELGLDPSDVKLVLLGHGHSDHYGGASYFQTTYGARVGTTEADWGTIEQSAASGRPGSTPAPSRDLTVREGEPIVLGDTTITPVEIPGHTPGALAFIFPVRDGGAGHVAGLFGGTVLAAAYTPAPGLTQYIDSIAHFLDVAAREGVDVEIQNHPIFDDTPARLAALAARTPGDPHPFVMGADGYQRFWRIVSECMQADILRKAAR